MTDAELKEDFRQDMLRDQAEERAEGLKEEKMSNDLQFLFEELDDEICDVESAIQYLLVKVNGYGWEMSRKELLENL